MKRPVIGTFAVTLEDQSGFVLRYEGTVFAPEDVTARPSDACGTAYVEGPEDLAKYAVKRADMKIRTTYENTSGIEFNGVQSLDAGRRPDTAPVQVCHDGNLTNVREHIGGSTDIIYGLKLGTTQAVSFWAAAPKTPKDPRGHFSSDDSNFWAGLTITNGRSTASKCRGTGSVKVEQHSNGGCDIEPYASIGSS